MTIGDISTYITFLTNADVNSFTNAKRLITINKHYNDVHTLILESQDEWDYDDSAYTDYPILTTNLVANQQSYILPPTTFEIKRLEISYDGTNSVKVSPFDVGERGIATASNAIGDFSQSEPYYDLQAGALFLYPIPTANVTAGLKIWISRGPFEFTSAELTTGTREPGFDSIFHSILALGPSLDYSIANNLPQRESIKREYEEIKVRMKKFYSDKQEDRFTSLKASNLDYK